MLLNKSDQKTANRQSKIPLPKSKSVQTVPDFDKLHRKWEESQKQRRLETKRNITIPCEFSFSSSSNNASLKPLVQGRKESDENRKPNRLNSQILVQKPPNSNVLKDRSGRVEFEACASSLHNILNGKGINEEQGRKSCFGRKSLGPPLRAVPNNSSSNQQRQGVIEQQGNNLRRKSIYDRNQTQKHSSVDSDGLSKLERRISTYFSKTQHSESRSKMSKDGREDLSECVHDMSKQESTSYRAGLTLLELQKTPGKSHLIRDTFGKTDKKDEEWMRQLAADIMKRERAEVSVDTSSNFKLKNHCQIENNTDPLDMVPTPPPPLPSIFNGETQKEHSNYRDINLKEKKIENNDDVTFKFEGGNIALVPSFQHDQKITEKSMTQLKRSPGELFKFSRGEVLAEDYENNGIAECIFTAPVLDSESDQDDAVEKGQEDTCEVFFSNKLLSLDGNQKTFQLNNNERKYEDDDEHCFQNMDAIRQELDALNQLEQELLKQLPSNLTLS